MNRLADEYRDQMSFAYLNAQTDGEAAFQELMLQGHPATLIFSANSEEIYRGFGVVAESDLRSAINEQLALDG